MSTEPSASTSQSNFVSVFNAALEAYRLETKKDLATDPLLPRLGSCDSPEDILTVLREQIPRFSESQNFDDGLTKWLTPTINVLYAFSDTIGRDIGLAFPSVNVIFAGIGVLLSTANDAGFIRGKLVENFDRIEYFFRRLEIYTGITPTAPMRDIIVEIMVVVLAILAIATKEVKLGRLKRFLKRLTRNIDIEDSLSRLDKLTQEEARLASAERLKMMHSVDGKVLGVDDKVKGVERKEQDVRGDVQDVGDKVQNVDSRVQGVDDKLLKLDQVNRNQLRFSLSRWLSPPDPSANHNNACNAHHSGTAQWLIQGSIFNRWKSTESLLWVHGKPGSGKSILCSSIIQATLALCDAGRASVAYFYFDFRDADKQNLSNLLPSLLIQLAARSDLCCDVLSRLYLSHDRGLKKPSDRAMVECFKEMLTLEAQGPTYIIMDALDECPITSTFPSPREEVLDFVEELVDLHLPDVHICVTSRPEHDIQAVLEDLAPRAFVSLHDESGQREDIVNYVTCFVRSNLKMRRWREEDKDLVIRTLSEKADGMFRWVFCQLEVLRHCFPSSVKLILEELPESLDETYERILREIRKHNQGLAHRLMQCLVAAVRPLRVEELAEVLAFDFSVEGIPKLHVTWRWEDQEEAVMSACSSLVTIVKDRDSRVVQFSHFSVKEFLTANRLVEPIKDVSQFHIQLEAAHTILAQACLGTLLRLDDRVDRDNVENFPLARYAGQYWVTHARVENASSRISDGMEFLFDADKPYFATWLWIYNEESGRSMSSMYPEKPEASPLYYAARFGFRDLVEHLIAEHPEHVNVRGGRQLTPMHVAAVAGHADILSLLLEHGANPEDRGVYNQTPLHLASFWGNPGAGRLLLERGADVNAPEILLRTPLHLAADRGMLAVARILLEGGADVHAPEKNLRTPLHLAADRGMLAVARLLLEHGANVDAHDKMDWTPLDFASARRHLELMRLLHEHGADVRARDNRNQTAFHKASNLEGPDDVDVKRHESLGRIPLHVAAKNDTANLLLEFDEEVDAPDKICRTPLHLAADEGKLAVARLLLERGAEVDAPDNMDWTALHFASRRGHLELVRLLLEHDADVLARNREDHTFLDVAWASGHKEIIDVNARYEDGLTTLHIASQHGDPELMRWLIDNSVSPSAEDEDQETPLFPASRNGKLEATRLLLDAGANANHRDWQDMTPLHGASENGHVAVTQLLLERNAAVNARHVRGWTPLHLASRTGTSRVVVVLLDGGAMANAKTDSDWTPLHLASQKGHLGVVELLLARHVEVNTQQADGETALHLAAFHGHHEVAQVLLDHGANLRIENMEGEKPSDLASKEGHHDIAQLLEPMALIRGTSP